MYRSAYLLSLANCLMMMVLMLGSSPDLWWWLPMSTISLFRMSVTIVLIDISFFELLYFLMKLSLRRVAFLTTLIAGA